jgi:hypothetical protein
LALVPLGKCLSSASQAAKKTRPFGADGACMNLTIAKLTTSVTDAQFQAAVSAITKQVQNEFAQEWGISASLSGQNLDITTGALRLQGAQNIILYFGSSVDDPTTGVNGALGYHSRTNGDVPYGFVYLDVCREYGETWTCTLSHEVLELLADPSAIKTIAAPAPPGRGGEARYDFEVCDPTQGDSYNIDGISVSNFVTKSYFGLASDTTNTNHMALSLEPFGVRPKGYFQYEVGQNTFQVNGPALSQAELSARAEARAKMGMGRRNQRRAMRLKQKGTASMSNQTLFLRLASDDELRRKVQHATVTAAYQVLKEAGISVTPDDIALANGDRDALRSSAAAAIRADTAGDLNAAANVVTAVATVGAVLGF